MSILKSASTYYHTCMDTKQIELVGDGPMKDMIQKLGKKCNNTYWRIDFSFVRQEIPLSTNLSNLLGSWPVTDANFDASNWNMMKTFVAVHKNISQPPLFNLYVAGDIKNSNENILVVSNRNVFSS